MASTSVLAQALLNTRSMSTRLEMAQKTSLRHPEPAEISAACQCDICLLPTLALTSAAVSGRDASADFFPATSEPASPEPA